MAVHIVRGGGKDSENARQMHGDGLGQSLFPLCQRWRATSTIPSHMQYDCQNLL